MSEKEKGERAILGRLTSLKQEKVQYTPSTLTALDETVGGASSSLLSPSGRVKASMCCEGCRGEYLITLYSNYHINEALACLQLLHGSGGESCKNSAGLGTQGRRGRILQNGCQRTSQ